MNKTRKKAILSCILVAVLVSVLTLVLFPYFEQLAEPAYQEKIQVWVDKMGVIDNLGSTDFTGCNSLYSR